MAIRPAVVADRFYEGSPAACQRHAEALLEAAELPEDLPENLYGGLVPHAGWVFSGGVAALTISALARAQSPQTLVLFGADHTGNVQLGEVFADGAWQTPLGEAGIDSELAGAVLQDQDLFRRNPEAHSREHSLEVQVPLIQQALPEARLLPVSVPPTPSAVEIGRAMGRRVRERGEAVRILGSTDLTHHGGHFGNPGGRGPEGVQWARKNDRRILELIENMDAEAVIEEAGQHQNACGAGAIAASIAACRELGAGKGILLKYTDSYEVIHRMYPGDPDDTTVGYASVVFA